MSNIVAALAVGLAALLAPVLPSCPTEDSVVCTWDAAAHGTGQGRSFVALWDDVIVLLP